MISQRNIWIRLAIVTTSSDSSTSKMCPCTCQAAASLVELDRQTCVSGHGPVLTVSNVEALPKAMMKGCDLSC